MNRSALLTGIIAATMIGLTIVVLKRAQSGRTLGPAGVKILPAEGTNAPRAYLPEFVPGYLSREIETSAQELATLPKDTTFGKRVYEGADGFELAVNIVLMGTDRTSIHKPEFCLVGQGLAIERRAVEPVRVSRPHPYDLPVWKFNCSRTVQSGDGAAMQIGAIYAYWFVSEDAFTTSHWEMMWLSARDLLLTGRLRRWGYVSCFAVFPPAAEPQAWERMRAFLGRAVPEFQLAAGPRNPVSSESAVNLTGAAAAR
jgi:hypothetical protein